MANKAQNLSDKSVKKSATKRNKPADQNIVNVVKHECCPGKATKPCDVVNSTSAYTKLAKNATRFDIE